MAVTNGSSRRDYSIPSLDDILDEKSLEQHKEFVQLIEKQVNTYIHSLCTTQWIPQYILCSRNFGPLLLISLSEEELFGVKCVRTKI